ncbi:hypothetical protein AB0M57_05945 [Streptomyces sp. NPDC051597]|uniref:hypothetical protein n=1 Tax=Streptomyces sp. NPDC051597 TaxID=3155049 RepID=UPI00341B961A
MSKAYASTRPGGLGAEAFIERDGRRPGPGRVLAGARATGVYAVGRGPGSAPRRTASREAAVAGVTA